ncbi:MAG: DUF4286 family protein [Cytophagales bacterium]|nr:MAG: DUF4286 family protein [Cytophagales bacterium]
MILYNMTVNIDTDISIEWMDAMKNKYIPNLLKSDLVKDQKFYRLLTEAEGNGETYSLQLFFESMKDFETYEHELFNPQLEQIYSQFQGKFVEFRSILASVQP